MLLDYYPSIDDEQHGHFAATEDDMFRPQGSFYSTGNYGIAQQAQYPGSDFSHYTTNTEPGSPQQQLMSTWTPTSGSSSAMLDWQGQVSMGSYMQATNQQTNSMAQYSETEEYSGLCNVVQAINRVPNVMSHQWMRSSTYRFNPSTGKTRTKDKYRVVYTDHQRLELEKEFRYSRYITIRRKSELATSLGLSERQETLTERRLLWDSVGTCRHEADE
ncbi:homeobox protein CHOX-CAD-like [Anneissia japonica]|uniref:homeobox protein CHOX-CAD-like n=1 Tax=Anneissia japonica TaxID=1529436 RepID=UPI0014257A71|nr:homeobox protein CHOX-CAD-like [Anneissia japonica]